MTPQSTEHRGSVPSRKWYTVAVLIFVAGMAGFAVFLIVGLSTLDDDFVRVTVPGQAELPLDPGAYAILYERGPVADGTGGGVIISSDVTGLRISVEKSGTGTVVPLTANSMASYSHNGVSGQSLFTFTLTEPGTYRLVAAYDDGRAGPQVMLVIARGFMGNLPNDDSWKLGDCVRRPCDRHGDWLHCLPSAASRVGSHTTRSDLENSPGFPS